MHLRESKAKQKKRRDQVQKLKIQPIQLRMRDFQFFPFSKEILCLWLRLSGIVIVYLAPQQQRKSQARGVKRVKAAFATSLFFSPLLFVTCYKWVIAVKQVAFAFSLNRLLQLLILYSIPWKVAAPCNSCNNNGITTTTTTTGIA